jgi:hypothetical protein
MTWMVMPGLRAISVRWVSWSCMALGPPMSRVSTCSSSSTHSSGGGGSSRFRILWNKPGRQATVYAEITEATLRALPGLLNPGRDGYDDTADIASDETADVEDLFESPIHPLVPPNGARSSGLKRPRHDRRAGGVVLVQFA